MEVKDLRAGPPRRWNERLDGICWLPRMIDKARAAMAGTLGDYLYGQSPMDHALLKELRLSHREFAAIVRDAPDDAAVVGAIAAHDPVSLDRARAWSGRMARKLGWFLWCLDADDGYRSTALHAPIAVVANAVSRTAKRLWPSRAAERAAGP